MSLVSGRRMRCSRFALTGFGMTGVILTCASNSVLGSPGAPRSLGSGHEILHDGPTIVARRATILLLKSARGMSDQVESRARSRSLEMGARGATPGCWGCGRTSCLWMDACGQPLKPRPCIERLRFSSQAGRYAREDGSHSVLPPPSSELELCVPSIHPLLGRTRRCNGDWMLPSHGEFVDIRM